ncbi:unnamed protein product [Pleuronectes platessa]|uniref:Uncharacterized protein n=1 Tax=Pleuronectes platessa TaxID=8262 RepID=A0A9N7UDA5_PLEPL|nr:unnamed protein product [Pleuronectes platessa]
MGFPKEKSTYLAYARAHAARNGHHKIMIQTVDTDVVVLAVAVAQTLQPEDELWLAFGTELTLALLKVSSAPDDIPQEDSGLHVVSYVKERVPPKASYTFN